MIRVMRHQLREYYGISTEGTGGTITTTYHYVNPGFTKLSETGGVQTETVGYIGDKAASTDVIGYENQWDYECRNLRGDAVCDDLRAIATQQKVGSDCDRKLVTVDMTDPVVTTSTPSTTEFHARCFDITVAANPPAGDPQNVTTMNGTLYQKGDFVSGVFDISDNTFTADA